jgi:hypothetical protein
MKQFGRRFSLIVGSSSDGIEINNLRIAFEVTKSLDKEPNPAKIRIWNLAPYHRAAIMSGQWKTVALSVGYEQLRMIYAGDITKRNVKREDMDLVIEVECGDGAKAFRSARVNMTLPAGTTDGFAAVALAGTMPDTPRGTMAVQRATPSSRPRVYCGNTRDYLSNVAHANNADWSIQDGSLIMLPANATLTGQGPLINESTGMIGMPQAKDEGLEVQCLCNPEITVGGVVRVESLESTYSGDYKVVAVKHNGDSMEGDWFSTLTCIGGRFQAVAKKTQKGQAGASVIDPDDDLDLDSYVESFSGSRVLTREPRVYSVEMFI